MKQVIDFEKDVRKAQKGEAGDVFYQSVAGMKQDLSGANVVCT